MGLNERVRTRTLSVASLLRSAPSAARWLSQEVTGPAKRRRPAIAWLAALSSLVVGTGVDALFLMSGAAGMPAPVSGFCCGLVESTGIWLLVRPKIRAVRWPVVRAAVLYGVNLSVSIITAQEALHLAPFAMFAVMYLVIGPMTAAMVTGRRNWQIVAWVVVSMIAATLIYGVEAWHLSLIGALAIVGNGATYWPSAFIFRGLAGKEGNDNAAVFQATALSGLVIVPIMFVGFLLASGPVVLGQASAGAIAGALGVGALSVVTSITADIAWKRGITVSAHGQLQSAQPVLALLWGLAAGQKPARVNVSTISGYLLICLATGAVARLFIERGDERRDGHRRHDADTDHRLRDQRRKNGGKLKASRRSVFIRPRPTSRASVPSARR